MARYKAFNYDRYVNNYIVQQDKATRAGYVMNERMLTEREARARYNTTKMMLKLEVESGERKAIGNVYQYMVRDQSAPNSWAMAKAMKKYVTETGQNIKLKDILYTEDLKQLIDFSYEKEYREQLKKDHIDPKTGKVNWKEIDRIISNVFFGSPE